MKYKIAGYFTVEAALILPMVISAIVMTVYLFAFQYNRCVMEQEMGLAVLYGTDAADGSMREFAPKVDRYIAGRTNEKYILWESTQCTVTYHNNEIVGTAEGRLVLPIPEWNFWNKNTVWQSAYTCRMDSRSPVDVLRLIHKMKGWWNDEN